MVRIQKEGLLYRSGYRRTGKSTGQDAEGRDTLQVRIQKEGLVYRSGYRMKWATLQVRIQQDGLDYRPGY